MSELYQTNLTRKDARDFMMRNSIAGTLLTEAIRRHNREGWDYGNTFYLLDSFTNMAARVDFYPGDRYAVKVTSRNAMALLEDLAAIFPALLDSIAVLD